MVSVLKSDWLTQGPAVPRFEARVTEYCGARYGIAVNSATSALHIACLALGLGPNDHLWTSPNTFVASANCGLYCGARVDFVDIDPRTYNMSVSALEQKLATASHHGCLPKVVVPVHFSGQSCDMQAIRALADRYGFFLIEDASHAIGGKYLGERIGNCRYADITVFSFHPVKIITTGEGGMALTNDHKLAQRMQNLRSHGITRDTDHMEAASPGPWYYEQIELGYNYRMTDIQAALGSSQISRLDEFVERRQLLAARYDDLLSDQDVIIPWQDYANASSWHLYVIKLSVDDEGQHRRNIFDRMRAAGIGVNVHYIPVHTHPYYKKLGFAWGMYPQSEKYYHQALSLPLHPGLSENEQDMVVQALTDSLQ